MSLFQSDLLQFPCQFPIKIMGANHPEFEKVALSIILKHVPTLAEDAIQTRVSKNERFLALTVTITATSKVQLDAIYQELTEHPLVEIVL